MAYEKKDEKLPAGLVNIRGKIYETVALRVGRFREAHPDWSITTTIIERTDTVVCMTAVIHDAAGRVMANGHAEEYRKASEINRTSALENCETSAIGRALACLGLGGTEFASADEVARAVSGAKGAPDLADKDLHHSPTKIAWEALQPEDQDFARKVAVQVTGAMPDGVKALDILEMADLNNDQKAGLWYLLDSKTRSALKKAKEAAA